MVELSTSGISHSPAPVGGRRRKSAKKVSAKTIRKTLRRLGMRPKGRVVLKGGEEAAKEEAASPPASMPAVGGRRRRSASVSLRMPKGLKNLLK